MSLSYSELITIPTFEDRFEYLKQSSKVADETFGGHRWLNQRLYQSSKWKSVRDKVIIRDCGCDLAFPGYDIYGPIYIHHINPISKEDILNRSEKLFDLENLVTVSFNTHQAIHYRNVLTCQLQARTEGDTKLW